MNRKLIEVGTRVKRYWRKGTENHDHGTVRAVVRDMFGHRCSEVRWDGGSVQLCANSDLRILRGGHNG